MVSSLSDEWIDSPLTLEELLVRIDARSREWRESTLPRGLRAIGVYGVRVRRKGASFTFQSQGGGRRAYIPVLVGRVQPRPEGGSRVLVRYRPSLGSICAMLLACAWLMGAMWLDGKGTVLDSAVLLLLVGLVYGLVLTLARSSIVAEQCGLESVLRATIEAKD